MPITSLRRHHSRGVQRTLSTALTSLGTENTWQPSKSAPSRSSGEDRCHPHRLLGGLPQVPRNDFNASGAAVASGGGPVKPWADTTKSAGLMTPWETGVGEGQDRQSQAPDQAKRTERKLPGVAVGQKRHELRRRGVLRRSKPPSPTIPGGRWASGRDGQENLRPASAIGGLLMEVRRRDRLRGCSGTGILPGHGTRPRAGRTGGRGRWRPESTAPVRLAQSPR